MMARLPMTPLAFFLALSLVLWPAVLLAMGGELSFDRVSIAQGLSHSSVWAIHQDSQGFLWVGTQEGLNRYDGYGFKVYEHDSEDPDSLSESEVLAILEDRRGEFWLGTRGGGLNRYLTSEERVEHFRHRSQDPASLSRFVRYRDAGTGPGRGPVYAMFEDRSGALWTGALGGGLHRLVQSRHKPEDDR